MKRTVMVLAMGLCTASVALNAQSGTIRFRGLIVHGTCADIVVVNPSPEPRRVPNGCAQGATGVSGTRGAPVYTEDMRVVSGHSGIDVLDYYVDSVRARSSMQVHMLTREYL